MKAIGWFLLAGCEAASCFAQQEGGKLQARELFYSAVEAPAPHKPAKSAAKAKTSHTNAPEAAATPASRANEQAQVIPAAYKPKGPRPPLGLRYTILKKSGDDQVETAADSVFHAGDRIRLAVEANDDGYLYVVNRGSSGTWKLLFPSPEIKDGDNHIQRRSRYEIPSGYTFTFDEQAGEEKLFVVLSREPEPDLERLIYNLGQGGKPAEAQPAAEKPKTLLASAAFNDDVIGKLRNAYARDLIVEKVDEDQSGPKKEKAVYAVNPSRSADSRVVADITLKHQ